MTEKQTRVSLKDLTDEQKKERKKIKQREYMAKRRLDPDFAESQRQLMRNYRQTEKYKEYNKEHCAKLYLKRKETIKDLKEKNKIFGRQQKLIGFLIFVIYCIAKNDIRIIFLIYSRNKIYYYNNYGYNTRN